MVLSTDMKGYVFCSRVKILLVFAAKNDYLLNEGFGSKIEVCWVERIVFKNGRLCV